MGDETKNGAEFFVMVPFDTKKRLSCTIKPKAYWSILKGFLMNKKIPCIPPILHESKFITNFKEKAELFNSFFAKQCSILDTGSTLPPSLYRYTNNSIASMSFTSDDIEKIINLMQTNLTGMT